MTNQQMITGVAADAAADTAAIDPRAFRRALGNFATGVTIVTATAPSGVKVGVTANSFNSVSLEPPLVLWSIDKHSGSYGVFEEASHFAVNILAADQIELSNHFARPNDDKFAGIAYQSGVGGAPLFAGCSAHFQCEKYQQLDGGDHWILIGRVVAFSDSGRVPLVYHQGSYASVLPNIFTQKRTGSSPSLDVFEGKLANNIYYLLNQAVRGYQVSYQPRQLATGLSTSEARILLVLSSAADLSLNDLQREVDMPAQEIVQAADVLAGKGLVNQTESGYCLTPAGLAQTEMLWDIAIKQQHDVLADFSSEEIETFKKILRTLMVLR